MPAITAEGLVKIYKSARARSAPSTASTSTVAEGTVLGLLGPNGAGKTTTVRILRDAAQAGRRPGDRGRLRRRQQADELRQVIGLSGQYAAVTRTLDGRENLWMFGGCTSFRCPSRASAPAELLCSSTSMTPRDRVFKTYSGGMRRRWTWPARSSGLGRAC
jgi:ABC-type multidrug transport system ATPase subunit